jgi:hypothetical protein
MPAIVVSCKIIRYGSKSLDNQWVRDRFRDSRKDHCHVSIAFPVRVPDLTVG